VRKANNLPPSCAVVMKSGNLNFLEPSELLRACNGTDLPLLFFVVYLVSLSRVEIVQCLVVGWLMNGELERCGRKRAWLV